MTLKLHGSTFSPPVRASLLTIRALGLKTDFKEVDTTKGDHLTLEYLQLNPLHSIPTLEDGEFVVWDSHAINAYLTDKYGKDDSLYPKDLQKRAHVDSRMYFDCGILFVRLRSAVYPILKEGAKNVTKENAASLTEAYSQLEALLEGNTYVAGDTLTLADFSIITTITSANILVPIASNRFPKISQWMARMQELPYYGDANQKGLDKFAELIKRLTS